MKDKARILIVDDQQEIRELLQEFLTIKGFTAFAAANGVEALTCLREQTLDLVLIDMWMPEMDGLETQRRMRAIDPDVKVIMLTGLNDEVVAQQAIRDGARDYLLKPLKLDHLTRILLAELSLAENAKRAS
jgi:DNA-binding NtrC family response regulator